MNFKNRILILFKALFLNRKFKCLIVLSMLLITDESGYKVCSQQEAIEICDKYVLNQKIYLNELKKRIVYFWSSRYYKNLNKYIRGYIYPLPIQKKQYDSFKNLLSSIIEESEGLTEDVILFRGEKDVDIDSRFVVGEVNTFVGFISTSFLKNVGIKFSKVKNNNNFLLVIKAKKGIKGIAINGKQLGRFEHQFEWLLNDGQKYVTENVDLKNKIIVIKLL